MPKTVPRSRFVWHELMTTDPDAAIGFYSMRTNERKKTEGAQAKQAPATRQRSR